MGAEEGKDNGEKRQNKGGYQRREREYKEEDKESNYYKYFYGPRPKIERVNVTGETEVPAIIPKEQRKRMPDKMEFEKQMKDLDTQIETLRQKIRSLGGKKKEVIEGGRVGNTQMTFKDYLKQKIDAVVEVKNKKRSVQEQLNAINDKLGLLEQERQQLRKLLHREHQLPAKIKEEIEKMQKRFETTTLSPSEEKKMMTEIR